MSIKNKVVDLSQLKNNLKMAKEQKKEVYLDIDGVAEILSKQNKKANIPSIAKELGYTRQGLRHIANNPPKILVALYYFMKENSLNFDDVVKTRIVK